MKNLIMLLLEISDYMPSLKSLRVLPRSRLPPSDYYELAGEHFSDDLQISSINFGGQLSIETEPETATLTGFRCSTTRWKQSNCVCEAYSDNIDTCRD